MESITSNPLPLLEWIKQTASSALSPEEYVEKAVSVALELTNCLLFDGADSSLPNPSDHSPLPLVQLNDIVSKNVLVHTTNDELSPEENIFSVTSVSLTSSVAESSESHASNLQLSSRDVCSALGRILFELVSKGQSFSIMKTNDELVDDTGPLLLHLSFCDSDGEDELFDNSLAEKNIGASDNGSNAELFQSNMVLESGSHHEVGEVAQASKKHNIKTHYAEQNMPMKVKLFLQEQCRLPLSICRLVSDLLEAGEKDNLFCSDSAVTSLDEAQRELLDMKTHPQRFLHDRICPSKAKDDTGLFQQTTDTKLYGRDEELSTLVKIAERCLIHVSSGGSATNTDPVESTTTAQKSRFLCDAAFISGISGSGKTSLIKSLLSSFDTEKWLLLSCKFDRQVAPLASLAKSFNAFFEQFVGCEDETYKRISGSIISCLDAEGLKQICELMPMFNTLFPLSRSYVQKSSSSNANVGYGMKRLHSLFCLLLKSIICGGYPVLFILDDLHWSDSFARDVILEVVQTLTCQTAGMEEPGGLFLLGSYRGNKADEDLLMQIKAMDQPSGNVALTQISIGELSIQDVNKMLSFKLGQPVRTTRQLSELIFEKTRGQPLFVIEFLRSIITKGMLSFSVRSRQWTWDALVLKSITISEDVAEFLASRLGRLDKDIVDALKVCSCVGVEVAESVVQLVEDGQYISNFQKALELAMVEGFLIKKAGPIYAFSHDMLRESTYKLISESEKNSLHKYIGLCLVQDTNVANNPIHCMNAVDQISFCMDILNLEECTLFAGLSLSAGKHSMAYSSYEQSRKYFELGIKLLHTNHWTNQYDLCLELYEMSVVVGFMGGLVENISSHLDAILANAKSFEDTLKARGLYLKVIASRGEYAEATKQCLTILSQLGSPFPEVIELSFLVDEINETAALLRNETKEHMMNFPEMANNAKLHSMRFLSMLCNFSMFAKPYLSHLSSCIMVKLTLMYGFCEESIHGLAIFSRALVLTNDVERAVQIGSLAESFISGHCNEHALRAKLLFHCVVKYILQPWQTFPEACQNGYNSGMLVGDIENAMVCGQLCCFSHLFTGSKLKTVQGTSIAYIHRMTQYKQMGPLNAVMAVYDACTSLTGSRDNSLGIKTIEELSRVAKQTQNSLFINHVFLLKMYISLILGEYSSVLEFSEDYKILGMKRIPDFLCLFFIGLAACKVGRESQQSKMKGIAEHSVETIAELVHHSSWNFENKLHLLQAELHYLNGDHCAAEMAYENSVLSAREHKFIHEEALAFELYGTFLIENKSFVSGLARLKISIKKYTEWGAGKKVDDLNSYTDEVKEKTKQRKCS